jgi:hypothetical protein
MPRPGPVRPPITLRLDPLYYAAVDQFATYETAGNRSEMVRTLLEEALTARGLNLGPRRPAG